MSLTMGQGGIPTLNTSQIAQSVDLTSPPSKTVAPQVPLKSSNSSLQGIPNAALKKAVGGNDEKQIINPKPAATAVSTQIRTRATFDTKGVAQTTRVQVKIPQDKNNAVLLQGTINSKNVAGARVGIVNITKLNKLTLTSEVGAGFKTDGYKGIDASVGISRLSGDFSASLTAEGSISNRGSSAILNPEIGVKLSDSLSLNAGREQSLTKPSDSFNYVGVALDINKNANVGIRFDDKSNLRVETKVTF